MFALYQSNVDTIEILFTPMINDDKDDVIVNIVFTSVVIVFGDGLILDNEQWRS